MENVVYIWIKEIRQNLKEEKLIEKEIKLNKDIKNIINLLKDKTWTDLVLQDLDVPNPSIERWVNEIFDSYPNFNSKSAEDLINLFRSGLYTRAKEIGKVVMLLQTKENLVLAHSKKEITLAEMSKGSYKTVKRSLDRQNVLRFVIFFKENSALKVSVFERNKKLTQGLREFLGITIEDIGWEILGSISFYLEYGNHVFKYEIDQEEVITFFNEGSIDKKRKVIYLNGRSFPINVIKIGNRIFSSVEEFYDYLIRVENEIETYRIFMEGEFLKKEYYDISTYTSNPIFYEEDKNALYKIINSKPIIICRKKHPILEILFSRDLYPEVRLRSEYLKEFYNSIFKEGDGLSCYHIGGLEFKHEANRIGSLRIHNTISNTRINEITNGLLKLYNDLDPSSLKIKYSVELLIFTLLSLAFEDLKTIFNQIKDEIIQPELRRVFEIDEIIEGENKLIEFKRPEYFTRSTSPKEFGKKINDYIENINEAYKIIYVGIDEKKRKVVPIRIFKDEFLGVIENEIKTKLTFLKIIRIPSDDHTTLMFIIVK